MRTRRAKHSGEIGEQVARGMTRTKEAQKSVYSSDRRASGELPRAKRSLGQNFLRDANVASRIVDALEISACDRVLEIGPGPGALTGLIRAAGPGLFIVLEKDRDLAFVHKGAGLQRNSALAEKNAVLAQPVLTDALYFAWERLVPEPGKTGWKVIGNLPYNIASPLMWELFSRATGLERAVFMIQKEVGARLTALPGTGAYGALTVWIRAFVTVRRLMVVPPTVFIPRPKVDSAVLVFTPLPERPRIELGPFAALLHTCFQQRRKQLGSILRSRWNDKVEAFLASQGLSRLSRPEELDPGQFQGLCSVI